MIAALIARGFAPWLAKLVAYAGLPLIALGLAWLALDAWGDSRYRSGKADEKAAWQAASDKLIATAAASGDAATRNEVPRLTEQAAKVEEEKERLDAAIENGSSPFDALFPADDGVR